MARDYFSKAQDTNEINLVQMIEGLRKKWRIILLVCVCFTAAGFLFACVTYIPNYTSRTTFVVSNRSNGGSDESDSLTSSDLSASTTLANTFQYILLSDEAMHSIIETYGLTLTIESLRDCIRVAPVSNTNILEMRVTTNSALLSKNIADKVIVTYPDVLDRTLKTASLEVLNWPRAADQADPYNGYMRYPLLGCGLALLLSLIGIYVTLILSDTIKTTSDIRSKLDLNIMASIPKVASGGRKAKQPIELLLTNRKSGFTFTESFKILRTKVETVSSKSGFKTYLISSALEDEGKTTLAINLSLVLAENGKKVLLIDTDLRKPSIYRYLGLQTYPPERGIDRVLRGDVSYDSAIVYLESYGISVLPSMNEVSDSSELLSSENMKELISKVSEQYDFVILDSTPATVFTDPAVLTAYTDAVILSLRQDYASAANINSVVQNLSENNAELIGCVFNIVDERGFGHGSYRYRYSAKYGKDSQYGKSEDYEASHTEFEPSK